MKVVSKYTVCNFFKGIYSVCYKSYRMFDSFVVRLFDSLVVWSSLKTVIASAAICNGLQNINGKCLRTKEFKLTRSTGKCLLDEKLESAVFTYWKVVEFCVRNRNRRKNLDVVRPEVILMNLLVPERFFPSNFEI